MANVVEASSYEEGQDYNEVRVAYRALAEQYALELGHVNKFIGSAMYRQELAQGHSETNVYASYPLDKKREAMTFIQENTFKLPGFWMNKGVLQRVGYDFYLDAVVNFGTRQIDRIITPKLIDRLLKFQAAKLEFMTPSY